MSNEHIKAYLEDHRSADNKSPDFSYGRSCSNIRWRNFDLICNRYLFTYSMLRSHRRVKRYERHDWQFVFFEMLSMGTKWCESIRSNTILCA